MIKSISDLLNEFVKSEVNIMNQQDIKHPTTIGSMFEGFTEKVLHRAIFEGLNLKIVSNSFIDGCSTEFDVLLVTGDGEKIPYTERYKFRPQQIVAIIQVKKNLYAKDIKDGYENLRFITDFYEGVQPEKYVGHLVRDSFRSICKKDIGGIKKEDLNLDKEDESILNILKIDALLPVRIVWGYNGFASEFSFREKFIRYLETNITHDTSKIIGGFGPHNFPNLIICDSYSMIKNNAMPYIGQVSEDKWWSFYTSSSFKPAIFFLEVLWTRLSYMFEELPSEIFGEDLEFEPQNRFIDCRINVKDGHLGWEYDYFKSTNSNLKENTETVKWEPVVVDSIQHTIFNLLCRDGEIDLNTDEDLEEFVKTGSYSSIDDFLKKMLTTELVFIDKNKIKLLTDQLQIAILPDGRYVVGENKSGRLSRWIMNQIKKK